MEIEHRGRAVQGRVREPALRQRAEPESGRIVAAGRRFGVEGEAFRGARRVRLRWRRRATRAGRRCQCQQEPICDPHRNCRLA